MRIRGLAPNAGARLAGIAEAEGGLTVEQPATRANTATSTAPLPNHSVMSVRDGRHGVSVPRAVLLSN